MTSETEPSRDEWRPWGGSDGGPEHPAEGSTPERPADVARTEDTQQIPFDEPVWATVQGGPLQPVATSPMTSGPPLSPLHAPPGVVGRAQMSSAASMFGTPSLFA